jgi:translation initiation factor IF-1
LPKEENVFELKGKVSDLLPNAMFRDLLDNGHTVVCVAAGKLRKNRIRVLQGDTVTVAVSGYDTSRGRIIFRG